MVSGKMASATLTPPHPPHPHLRYVHWIHMKCSCCRNPWCYVYVVMSTGTGVSTRPAQSEEPAIHPTAHVRDSQLGPWTAVGARTSAVLARGKCTWLPV